MQLFKRRVIMKKITLMLIIIILFLSCAKKEKIDFGFITFYYGEVIVKHLGKKTAPKLKMVLKSGDKVYTKKDARIDIQLQNFGLVRINENSEVDLEKVITEVNESIEVGLDNGQILCKLSKLQKNDEFQVHTPTAVAGVRGTTFLVESQKDKGTSEIAVASGSVEVVNKNDPENKKVVKQNETAKVDKKSKIMDVVKKIDTKKLKEFKAIKDVKVFKDLKKVKVNDLKKLSVKNLKSLNIKDMKGLGEEFKSFLPSKKGPTKEPSKVDETKEKVEETKKQVEEKKEVIEEKKEEVEEEKKKVEDATKKAKDKLKGFGF